MAKTQTSCSTFLTTRVCLARHVVQNSIIHQRGRKGILLHTCRMHVERLQLPGSWSNLLHANCPAVVSPQSQSITHFLTSILFSPVGQKCPSLGQKEDNQDGRRGTWEREGWVCPALICHCFIHTRNARDFHFLWSMSIEIPADLHSSKAEIMLTDRVTGHFLTPRFIYYIEAAHHPTRKAKMGKSNKE